MICVAEILLSAIIQAMKQNLFTKVLDNIKLYIVRHPWIAAGAAAVALGLILFISISSCSNNEITSVNYSSGIVLEDTYWETDDKGFMNYNKEGYSSSVGIDISQWVEDIDFTAVKKYGVEYVILRLGYRGYTEGGLFSDENFEKYIKAAQKAGLKVGVYFVTQAISEDEAVEEAEYVLKYISGHKIEMPVYIDMEEVYDTARTDELTADDFTRVAAAFCKKVEEAGYRGGIYANETWFNNKLDFDKIKHYDIWLAKYSDTLSTDLAINMWQYSSEGTVDGTEMWVDMNVRVSESEG